MRLTDYIHLCMDIELAVADLYEQFSRQFADDVELSTFWRLSAEAERYHAATVRIQQNAADPEAELDDEMVAARPTEALALLERLKVSLAEVRAAPPTVAEALALATRIESDAGEMHARTQFGFLFPNLQELFSSLAEEDRAHRKSFEIARRRFVTAA